MAKRIQRRRTKGWRMPPNTIYVGRPTLWGNDYREFSEGYPDKATAVAQFAHDLDKCACFHPDQYEAFLAPLRGKDLACWCPLDQPCHADVLLERAAATRPTPEPVDGENR